MKKNNKKAYSIIIIILIIGFLIVLTSGIFKLVMNDYKDNLVLGNYIKTYAGAESGKELALFNIKELNYPYIKGLEKSDKILNKDCEKNCVGVSFENNSLVNEYTGELKALESNIIYLYYFDNGSLKHTENLSLEIISGDKENLYWTIIEEDTQNNNFIPYNGKGDLNQLSKIMKISNDGEHRVTEVSLTSLLSNKNKKTITITSEGDIKYKITSSGKFISPEIDIISSGEIGIYRSNINTKKKNQDVGGAVTSFQDSESEG